MGLNEVELFLSALRDAVPNAEAVFKEGNCFKLYLLLRRVFPQAKPYYSLIAGHVYTEIDGRYYDIDGKHVFAGGKFWGIGSLTYMPTEPAIFKDARRWRFERFPDREY